MNHFSSVQLSNVVSPVERPEAPIVGQTYRQVGVRLWGQGAYERESIDGGDTQYRTLNRVERGDIIVNKIWARNGSVSVVWEDTAGCYVSGEFPLFVPDQAQLDSRWFFYLTKTPDFWRQCDEKSFGTSGKNRIRPEKFLEIEIPLPPLDEQRRIVAQIDAIAERVAAARGLRHGALEEAEALLYAVKNDVFSDEYVASFPSVSLGDVSDIQSGVTLGRKLAGDTISLPYLRVANVQDGYLDLAEVKEVEVLVSEFDKWQLQFGDILLTEGGDWDKLGRGTVWQDEIPNCIHQNHIFRVRVDLEAFDPHFLMALISSPRGKRYFQDASKQTTNLASINQRQLKAFLVFCPPLKEQRLIVEETEEVGRQVAYFKRVQAETAAELDALLPSVLDRAFRGEL